MSQRFNKFILKIMSPNTLATGTVTPRIAGLNHKVADHAVEEQTVVVAVLAVSDKVLAGLWSFFGEELQMNVTQRGVQRHLTVHFAVLCECLCARCRRRTLIENIATGPTVRWIGRFAPGEHVEARLLEGHAEESRIRFGVHLQLARECRVADAATLVERQPEEAFAVLDASQRADHATSDQIHQFDAGECRVQQEVATLVEDGVRRRGQARTVVRVGLGWRQCGVLRHEALVEILLVGHASSKVQRVQLVCALLLLPVLYGQRLVDLETHAAAGEAENTHTTIAAHTRELLTVAAQLQRVRARLALCELVEVGLTLVAELQTIRGQVEGRACAPVLDEAALVRTHTAVVGRVVGERTHRCGVYAHRVQRLCGDLAAQRVVQIHGVALGVAHRQHGALSLARPVDPGTAARCVGQLDHFDHVEGDHVEELEAAIGTHRGQVEPVHGDCHVHDGGEMRPEVLHKLDALWHLLPELEMSVLTSGHHVV
mmetsp:Transcript_10932/g.27630  ORF Transcript_10932/g.27630 Transcript_10932/m.27630 type:complete len:486 (+) Transcript_10932:299-1756(+)